MDKSNEYKGSLDPALLAIEGNGAVQVDASPDKVPPIVTLCGPIKIWWSEWGSQRHIEYTKWRDAVRVSLVHVGCAVYSPHRAIQGSWNEKLQDINDTAIRSSNLIVVMTPPDVPADGTMTEMLVAQEAGVPIYFCPPGTEEDLRELVMKVSNLK